MKLKNLGTMVLAALAVTACSNKTNTETAQETQQQSNTPAAVVCYFSATGNTKAQAERIAGIIGADLYEITPETVYTEADLDWRDENSRSTIEMKDPEARPAIADTLANMNDYQIVFVGFPNWWNTTPRIINTFIESYDLDEKTIVPFMTSGSSDISNSEKELHEKYPTLNFAPGRRMNDITDEEIIEWLTPLGLVIAQE